MVACIALAAYLVAVATITLVLYRNLPALIAAWIVGVLAAVAVWFVVTRQGVVRLLASAAAVVAVVAVAWILVAASAVLGLLVVFVTTASATGSAAFALGAHRTALAAAPTPGVHGTTPRHPVLILNPGSGGGKVERFDLPNEAASRGIEAVVLGQDGDLQALARDAVARGADALGAAGGDGTQALVAEIAMEHDLPYVCVPAGTRNHLALDLGVDRDDVVGALDAFADGLERRVDLALVNDRLFVNNVSVGVYAKIVQSDEYRDDKLGTVARMLPELLGPECEPFDLQFEGPNGNWHDSADLILVSNNVYELERIAGFGSRARMDGGVLGVVAIEVGNAAALAELVALQTTGGVSRFRGWRQWTATSFEVRSHESIDAGVDGEALSFDSPLRFRVLPGALRVRVAARHPGRSPAAVRPAFGSSTVARLGRLAFTGTDPGRPV